MNSSEVIRCQNCNSNIYQWQRYCDKCGRENISIGNGTLCTGKINGIHCSNVINPRVKFCSSCGTENSSYVSDTTIGRTVNRDHRLQSEDDVYHRDNLEAQAEDLSITDDSNSEKEVNQGEKWKPPNTAHDAELNEIYTILKDKDITYASNYIKKKLAEVNTMILKFAVIGRSAVGKSSFINLMLDLQLGDKCYADTGAGDTTKNKYAYQHPKNENITFWDMPGFGTMEMPIETFSSKFGFELNTFDYFFIFIDTVIMEGDLWLVDKIKGYRTPYCFVRSKLDEDIKKGRTKEDIRLKLESSIEANSTVKGSALFIISNEKSYIHTGDFRQLFSHITTHLPSAKAESLSFFLPILTPEMIEEKFQALNIRMKYVAFSAGFISGISIPSLENPVNFWIIGKEIEEYYRVFLLDKDMVRQVQGVKHRKFSKNDIKEYIATFFKSKRNVEHVAPVPTSIFGRSAFMLFGYVSISAGTTVYKYAKQLLIKTLFEMTEDAHTVYDYYTKAK